MDWLDQAKCRKVPTQIFFSSEVEQAKKICYKCPMLDLCLYWIMSIETDFERYGVYGGATSVQRQTLSQTMGKRKATRFYETELKRLGFAA